MSGDAGIADYRIEVPESVLADLNARLAATRFPDHFDGVGWEMGVDVPYIKELVEYWRTEFDWRAVEEKLNRFSHFTTTIDGQNIHFMHVRSEHADALPLLLLHGWPGSVIEFLGVIDRLIDPSGDDADAYQPFHLVIPSLPGYGFSGPTHSARLEHPANGQGICGTDESPQVSALWRCRAAIGGP